MTQEEVKSPSAVADAESANDLQSGTPNNSPGLKKAKRFKLPRDSLIVYIPLNVTADLGVAMKRARAKNIAKYKQMMPHLFEKKKSKAEETDKSMTAEDDGSNAGSMNISEEDGDGDSQMRSMDKIGSEVRREQFSSMVDYLEAKYARGVMIHDLDERIREKKKLKSDGKAEGGDLSVLSDSEAGSCYSEESGDFIDDSDLRTDVAHQILASSAFGTTKIEADAMKAQEGGKDDDSFRADDHAFFVNIGDLEMEDGWNDDIEEDQDWLALKKSKGYVQQFVIDTFFVGPLLPVSHFSFAHADLRLACILLQEKEKEIPQRWFKCKVDTQRQEGIEKGQS